MLFKYQFLPDRLSINNLLYLINHLPIILLNLLNYQSQLILNNH